MVVHGVGGFAGLAGAIILGPRLGRCGYYAGLGKKHAEELAARHKPNSIPLAALGVFILWVGWYGFNGGTVFAGAVSEEELSSTMQTLGIVVLNTTIAPAFAVICVLVISFSGLSGERIYISNVLNAILTGLVGITAACDKLTYAEAALIGVISGLAYLAAQEALVRLNIDDPVGAFPVHGIGGLVGVAAVSMGTQDDLAGITGDVDFTVLQTQLMFGLIIGVISFSCAYLSFFLSGVISLIIAPDVLVGKISRAEVNDGEQPLPVVGFIRSKIRYDTKFERTGLDLAVHGQRAYNAQLD